MHLCNTGTKGSKARYILQRSGSNGFTNSTHRTTPALEVARGRGRARYIWWQHPSGGSDCYFPEITSCRGQAPHCKPETASSTQTPGEKMPPPHTPQNAHMHSSPGLYLKTRTPPSHPSGLHGTSLSQEQSTDKLTLPRWWQQSVKPVTLNYFYSWL